MHTLRKAAKHTSGCVPKDVPQMATMQVGERMELGRSTLDRGGTAQWAESLGAVKGRRQGNVPKPALYSP